MSNGLMYLADEIEDKLWNSDKQSNFELLKNIAHASNVYFRLMERTENSEEKAYYSNRLTVLKELRKSYFEDDIKPTELTLENLDAFVERYWNISETAHSVLKKFRKRFDVALSYINKNIKNLERSRVKKRALKHIDEVLAHGEIVLTYGGDMMRAEVEEKMPWMV
ncbi:hypothetical protein JXB11_00790, partial [Candidatus Woesearchaeota archaeon]|nr:hypothetical protein [Candidatus Woesearchaeota archaeon]